MLPQAKLDILLARHATLEAELLGQVNAETYVRATRELSELSPVVDAVKAYRSAQTEIKDIDALIADPSTDAEMRQLAEVERPALEEKRVALEQQIRLALLPKDAMDERSVVLEIRAGTGGDEASLFAGDLFRMYERFAALQGWKVEVISASEGTVGGFKEIIAEIQGRGAYAKLKFESGVHRVQRVPDTEGSGRIHTSAATVAVLPEVEDVDVEIEGHRAEDRDHALAGRRRPARQQDRIGDPHHPSADGHRRQHAGRPLAAPQPRQGDDAAARETLRCGKAAASIRSAPPSGAARSAPATAPSASAPTTSRKGASPTIAST